MKIDFSRYSSVKIGGVFEVEVLDSVREFAGVVVGGANNLLVSPTPPPLAILGEEFDYTKFENGILEIGGATNAAKIFKFARENHLGGFEILGGIPGRLGGLVTMNAGLKGLSIGDNLLFVIASGGEIAREDCGLGYRASDIKGVIFGAKFEIKREFDEDLARDLAQARRNQPKGASFGSCFANPENDSAGRLIEAAGLKGKRIGGCGFSEKHANFLINYGGGTFADATALINLAKKAVFERFGVKLREEVRII